MTPFTKFACAFALAGAFAIPAYADSTNGGVAPSDSSPKAAATQSEQTAPSSESQAGAQNMTSNGQSSMNNSQSGMTGAQNPHAMQLSQRLRSDLSKAGFTDITVMPTSFLVRAKDSQGNPIMMVVNPDSITAVTESGSNANSNSASNANRNTGNSAGATPGPSSTGGSQPVTPGSKGQQP